MDAYPEAKSLNSNELLALYKILGNWHFVADEVGGSEAFVRQNANRPKTSKVRGKLSKLRHSNC